MPKQTKHVKKPTKPTKIYPVKASPKQKTIGTNPLTEYLMAQPALDHEPSKQIAAVQEGVTGKKQRLTVHISDGLVERIKNAVYWEPGFTIAAFAEDALAIAIEKLEEEKGAPYPQRKSQLKGGRPMK